MADNDKPSNDQTPPQETEQSTDDSATGKEPAQSGDSESKTTKKGAARPAGRKSGSGRGPGRPRGTRSGAGRKAAASSSTGGSRKSAATAKPASAASRRRTSRASASSAPRPQSKPQSNTAKSSGAASGGDGSVGSSKRPRDNDRRQSAADRAWRFIGIVGFAVVSGVVLWLAWAVALLQYVHLLVRQTTNSELSGFMDHLTAYIGQILDYLAGRGRTDEMPFPFSEFPKTGEKARGGD